MKKNKKNCVDVTKERRIDHVVAINERRERWRDG